MAEVHIVDIDGEQWDIKDLPLTQRVAILEKSISELKSFNTQSGSGFYRNVGDKKIEVFYKFSLKNVVINTAYGASYISAQKTINLSDIPNLKKVLFVQPSIEYTGASQMVGRMISDTTFGYYVANQISYTFDSVTISLHIIAETN